MKPRVRLHDIDTSAEALGCTPRWLGRMAAERRIPFALVGGRYRFSDAHLEAIVALFEVLPEDKAERSTPRRRRRAEKVAEPAEGVTPLRARTPRRLRQAAGP